MGWEQVADVPAGHQSLSGARSASSARGGGTPGQACRSSCRRLRRSSSLLLGRSLSQGRRSSTWPAPSTCSVSSGTKWESGPRPGPVCTSGSWDGPQTGAELEGTCWSPWSCGQLLLSLLLAS